MGITKICKSEVAYVYRATVASEAARLMRDRHVGCLVVVEESDRSHVPVGILTDRDIVVAIVARDQDARTLSVGQVMSPNPVTVREDASLTDTLRLMRRRGVRRLPVVDAHGRLVGIATLDDVLGLLAHELGELASAIQSERAEEIRTTD